MKQTISFLLLLVLIFSCKKSDDLCNPHVFMDKVKTETYNEMFLPDFEPADINVLLEYRNDKTILNKFPTNPISSMIGDSVTVGNIALWTIESIRISELNGDTSEFMRYPSLNPMMKDTVIQSTNKFVLQDIASKKYFDWWCLSALPPAERMFVNPLNGSNIIWF